MIKLPRGDFLPILVCFVYFKRPLLRCVPEDSLFSDLLPPFVFLSWFLTLVWSIPFRGEGVSSRFFFAKLLSPCGKDFSFGFTRGCKHGFGEVFLGLGASSF